MKKPKLSLGRGGIKGLFVQHVEKLVFGIALLFVVVFIFLGYRLDSKLAGKTPDKLEDLAANAVSNIERPTFEEVKKERTPRDGKGGQYVARVDIARNPLVATVFETDKPWDLPPGRPGMKREDPELFPPIKFELSALTGAICVRSEDESPLADLDNAPAGVEKPKRVKQPRRPRGGGSGGSMMPGSFGPGMTGSGSAGGPGSMGSSGPGGGFPYDTGDKSGRKRDEKKEKDRKTPPSRRYPADKVEGYRPAGTASMMSGMGSGGSTMPGMGSGGSMMPGMGSGGSMMPGMGSGGSMMPGMGSGGSMMPGMGSGGSTYPGSGGRSKAAGKPIGKTQQMIAVKALAPYRKQADEFKRVLGEAIGYDPLRDMPHIVYFQAQRVDVTADPTKEPAEGDWELIMYPRKASQMAEEGKWDGFMPEVADANYVDPNITMPGPPIMLRDMNEVMLHSEVPRSTMVPTAQTLEEEGKEGEEKKEKTPETTAGEELPGGVAGAGTRGRYPGAGGYYPGMGTGGSMMPGMGTGGSTMYPGAGTGGSMMPGMGTGGSTMYPGAGTGGSMMPGMGTGGSTMYPGAGTGGSMMPGMGSGGSMYPGMGGGYGRAYSARMEATQFKLIRFFDMDVEPGHVYRYRVRLFIEDPNNPNTDPVNGAVFMVPRRRTLSMKVIDRLNKQQADPKAKKAYYVITKWSDASDPVSLPSTSRAYVGEVTPARFASGVDGAQVAQSDVSGSVVPVVWDDRRAIDVAKEMKVSRGSVLNTKPPFDVLDPVTLVIKLLKDSDLNSQFMVVDMRGGEDLPSDPKCDRKDRVTSVGEFIMLDDQGNLIVRNELDDYQKFRRFTLEDEVKMSGGGGGMYGPGSGSGGPGMGSGGSMMPGMGSGGSGGIGPSGPDLGGGGVGPGTGLTLPGTGAPGSGGGSRRGGRGRR